MTAIQILGMPFQPTHFTGSTSATTPNSLDLGELFPLMRHGLGLAVESMSIVSAGSRRRGSGDYPRVYDTLIGTPPYAGRRETWLLIRVSALENGDALRWRPTIGTAAL